MITDSPALIIHAQKPGTSESVCGEVWVILRKREHATCPDCLAQSVDSPLGLTEQQRADSALNEMIETLPSPFKNMSGMYNGMTVRPTAQPVDNPVDNALTSVSTSEAPNASAEA